MFPRQQSKNKDFTEYYNKLFLFTKKSFFHLYVSFPLGFSVWWQSFLESDSSCFCCPKLLIFYLKVVRIEKKT